MKTIILAGITLCLGAFFFTPFEDWHIPVIFCDTVEEYSIDTEPHWECA